MDESNDNIPDDEMDLAEELAELHSDPDFFPSQKRPSEWDRFTDEVAEYFATELDDEQLN